MIAFAAMKRRQPSRAYIMKLVSIQSANRLSSICDQQVDVFVGSNLAQFDYNLDITVTSILR